jgi:hypothetical protein
MQDDTTASRTAPATAQMIGEARDYAELLQALRKRIRDLGTSMGS